MRHLIPISGKDSLATALVQTAYEPQHEYEYFVNVVNKELPPFYDWLDRVELELGKPIVRIGEDLEEVTRGEGFLPSSQKRFCTRLAKIEPMERYISGDPAIVYYGLRADEAERVGYKKNASTNIVPKYPLREYGLNLQAVWAICEAKGLLPPAMIFHEVVSRVEEIMGADFAIVDTLRPWHYNKLFSWRSRPFNCFDCFYGRQYEYIGLSIYYPDEFERACRIEETVGADDYTLRQGYSLRQLVARKDEVIEKRVNKVVKTLYKVAQFNIFDEEIDELMLTSCGLLCGK